MATSESLSISSRAAGTTRRRISSDTASTAPRMPSKVASIVAFACGFGTSRSVIFVMIASVPSEPTSSCVRSYPTTFFTAFEPVVTTSPVGSTASSARM